MPKKEKELMSTYVAVFNCHVNDAKAKADAQFKRAFGLAKFNRHIKPYDDEGIMSIFDVTPNQYRLAWVMMVTVLVNQKGLS